MERWHPRRIINAVTTAVQDAYASVGGLTASNTIARYGTPQDFVRLQPILVEVEDSGAADGLIQFKHGLGRVPVGLRLVNIVVASGSSVCWYRLVSDPDWTEDDMSFRVRVANARLLLEVF